MIPAHDDFWFLPLGGVGEIGMNMALYGHDEQWLMVDCGVTFRDSDGTNRSGYDVQCADPTFAIEHRDKLVALVLTHAHEDHIGAVAHLWPQLRCPIYTNAFTSAVLHRKLAEAGLVGKAPVNIVDMQEKLDIGVFSLEWVAHTHSVPSPAGLVIRTAVGNAFHTGDWKLDPAPQIGHDYSEAHYKQLGEQGIDVMVCDSTCANVPGRSASEGEVYKGLLETISQCENRVVVACFGSNIARLHSLARIAALTNRNMGLLGRSLRNNYSASVECGLWELEGSIVESEHLAYLPPENLLLVATGSQAEPRTALFRLSQGRFRDLSLEPGDCVILSSRAIPGNEQDINSMITRLTDMGVKVITPLTTDLVIHASGHPARDELSDLYRWVQPDVLIPVHGESEHMDAQADFAKERGIDRSLVGQNGDLFTLAPGKSLRRRAVDIGRWGYNGKAMVKIDA
ncbi:MAG: ribonuclease J [Granulosicoccaceae bacterium]